MQNRSKGNAQGIDVSHHQGKIDWSKVPTAGISFVIIKASEGKAFRDNRFNENMSGAKKAGLITGAYHFMNAATPQDAVLEAQNFNAAITGAGGASVIDLPPVLDYENNPFGIGKTQMNAVAKAFLTEIERLTGRTPMVYSGNSFAQNFDTSLGSYPLWIARYGTKPPSDVSAWKRWRIWQYSDSGKIAGIVGNVDLNEYDGTVDDLKAWIGSGKKEEPLPMNQRDINQVSSWAAEAWTEATKNGYFDGTRPGAPMTREEAGIVVNRLRKQFLELIAQNQEQITKLEQKLKELEQKS